MRNITVRDRGRSWLIQIAPDVVVPSAVKSPLPAYQELLIWWVDQTKRRGYPLPAYQRGTSIRLARSLLKRYTLEALKEYGVHFFLDHGHELTNQDTLQLPFFVSKLPGIIETVRLRRP